MLSAALARSPPDLLRPTLSIARARSRGFAGATKVRGKPDDDPSERRRRAEITSATEPIDVLGSLRLRLITERCPLFHVRDERELPFPAPWWAFLWPGGLGLTRFLLEDSRAAPLLRGKSVLEVGSGCGSASIAAAALGARKVVANDICPYAGSALALNVELNEGPGRLLADVPRDTVSFVQENQIGAGTDIFNRFDVVLVGDMLYGPRLCV
jgi:predicted nicotinamide N-methyase